MKTVIDSILSIFRPRKTDRVVFFGYSAKEKRKIVLAASRKAAKMQQETVNQYHRLYGSK